MKLLPSLFSCVYGRVKLSVFAMNSRRRYSIFVYFIYGLEENLISKDFVKLLTIKINGKTRRFDRASVIIK